jgi:hypothetical protein
MYCGSGRGGNPVSKSSGGKPFIITETAATIHMAILMLDNSWVPILKNINRYHYSMPQQIQIQNLELP